MNVSSLNTTGWPHKDPGERLGPGEPTALLRPPGGGLDKRGMHPME